MNVMLCSLYALFEVPRAGKGILLGRVEGILMEARQQEGCTYGDRVSKGIITGIRQ